MTRELNLLGTIEFEFEDINDFYSSFQTKKLNRKNIEIIEVNFVYNFNSKSFRFDNPRINNSQNEEVEKLLDNFNLRDDRTFNKITFKNFINSFFEVYDG